MQNSQPVIKINPLKIAVTLFAASLVVLIFSLLGQRPYQTGNPTEKFFRELFTTEFFINNRENIATYWNMLILIIACVLIFIIASTKNAQKSKSQYAWYVLGVIFAFFAIDTLAGVSDRFIRLLRDLPTMEGGFLYNWLYPVTWGILLLLLVFFIWFHIQLDVRNKFLFPLSMLLYVFGAYKTQLLGSYYAELYGSTSTTYLFITHAQEFAEYLGIILMIYLLLIYLTSQISELEFTA
jgi:hypothetical protein